MTRDQRVEVEASALWRQVFDGPPPADLSGPALLEIIVQRAEPTSYDRLWRSRLRDVVVPNRPAGSSRG